MITSQGSLLLLLLLILKSIVTLDKRFVPAPKIKIYFKKPIVVYDPITEFKYQSLTLDETISKIFLKSLNFHSKDLRKTIKFYEFILVDTNSIEITHVPNKNDSSNFSYLKLKTFKTINPPIGVKEFLQKNLFQSLLLLNLTLTKITSKFSLEYFDFQVQTIQGSFHFVKMPTKSIFLYGSFNGGIILVLQTIFYQHHFKNLIFNFQELYKRIHFII